MPFSLALILAAVTGFLVISLEILWYRAFAFSSGLAAATGPLLVAASLAGFAEGAWFARSICARFRRTNRTARTTAVCFAIASVVGVAVIPLLARIVGFAEWTWALPFVAVACAGFGAGLTLVAHLSVNSDQLAGVQLSRLGASAIGGAITAVALTGIVLTQELQTAAIARCLVLIGAGAALAVAIPATHGREKLVWSGTMSAAALLIAALSPLLHASIYERMLYKDQYRGERFDALVENRYGVVGVAPNRHIVENGIDDGLAAIDVDDGESRLIRAFAIPALSASPKRILVIGLGTGAWPRIVAGLHSVEDVTILDASPENDVVSKSEDVAALLQNPRIHMIADDPRRWLQQHPDSVFDVIISPETLNWRAHSSHLLSVEFMAVAKAHLDANGVFYFNTADAPSAFKAAFNVFPNGLRFLNFAAVSMAPVGFDEVRWRRALADYRLNGVALFDTTTARGKTRMTSFLATPNDGSGWFGSPALESRASMLPRLAGVSPITDDNMGGEWRVGVRTTNW